MANKKRLSREFINGLNNIQIEYLYELIGDVEVPKTDSGVECSVCKRTLDELYELICKEMEKHGWS